MARASAFTVARTGVEGHLVEVEADIRSGRPAFVMVGWPEATLSEARDRVRAATANSGHALPPVRISVALSPAGLPKPPGGPAADTSLDLAVAAALLAAAEVIPAAGPRRFVHVGELGLDGSVRAVRGVFPAVCAAVEAGWPDVVVAVENRQEAALVPGARVWPVRHLRDVIRLHHGLPREDALIEADGAGEQRPTGGYTSQISHHAHPPLQRDLAEVIARHEARWALEVAAAGGHHLLLVGPPGSGQAGLVSCLPGLLPDLDDAQALEVSAVHSVAGILDPAAGLIRRPPFQNPHHTATLSSIVGGGTSLVRPGAASLAHRGVLFLDQVGEFTPHVLDVLRRPLEYGELLIHRAHTVTRFPARFQLVLATRPCPCGLAPSQACSCSPAARRRYLARLPGPLLDRVGLRAELPTTRAVLSSGRRPEDSASVAARVATARSRQRERLAGTRWLTNAEVSGSWLRGPLRLAPATTRDVDTALERGELSLRGYDQVLRVAWTLADLAGHQQPERGDLTQALHLHHQDPPTT